MWPSTGQASAVGLPPEAEEVRSLLAKGNTKSAVEAAKLLHKKVGSPASEALLVDAYLARALSMVEHHLAAEADALIAMAKQRYPASAVRLEARWNSLAATGSALDETLRPLTNLDVPAETRTAIEQVVRTSVVDLAALAQSSVLPADHPLRQGAAAILQAFEAVTSGPVDDAVLVLPSVSRRSPLAPWKPLLRAIACFYRHEDDACLEHLRAIDADSAASRLVRPLHAMIAPDERRALPPAATALTGRVCGNLEAFRESLARLDRHLRDGGKRALTTIRDTIALAQHESPELLAELRQQIAVRAMMADMQPGAVVAALGGAPKNDARYCLQLARAMEMDEDLLLPACHMWDDFRVAAIAEGWFPARGPEVATVYLHMAEVASRVDPEDLADELEDLRDQIRQASPEGFATDEPEIPFVHPEWLFEQACAMDPDPATFLRWVDLAEQSDQPQSAERAALAWHRALPADPRPLLRLMRYAEDREALKKALGYLRQAESLDGVNAEVRRARLRLLVLGAIRHLKQRKPHLAEPEIKELESLPQARENDRPAFIAALRTVALLVAGEQDRFLAAGVEIQRLVGSKLAGAFALAGVGAVCGLPLGVTLKDTPGSMLEAIPRVWAMGQDLGFFIGIPFEWRQPLLAELKARPVTDVEALDKLGEMMLRQGWKDAAYAVSAAGLAAGTADARFLFLRARALPPDQYSRMLDCVQAAVALAGRRNEVELANRALDYWRRNSMAAALGMELEEIGERELQEVLHFERKTARSEFEARSRFDYGPRRRTAGRRRRKPAPRSEELPF